MSFLALRTVPTIIQKYCCAVYDYAVKADLSKGYWNSKRKLGVTTLFFFFFFFLEIIKQQLF